MRNSIDREAYKLLFGFLVSFIAVLTLVTVLLFLNPAGFSDVTFKVSGLLLLLMISLSLYLRSEYLKIYNNTSYNTQKISLWAGSAAAFVGGLFFYSI